jgi:hypothetical protein
MQHELILVYNISKHVNFINYTIFRLEHKVSYN